MRAMRLLVSTMLAVGVLPLVATSASAAPPGNDEAAGAVALKLGGTVVQDTSEATTTAGDTALNEQCEAPATTASVWFTYTPDRDRAVVLDVSASGYSAGVLVFAGAPTPDSLEACGPGAVALLAQAGTTYTVMAISDSDVNGGRLVLSLKPAPPAPRVHVTVDRRGRAYRNGDARIHGHYSCRGADGAEVYGTLVQRAGRLKIPAEFGLEGRCDGRRHRWSARLVSPTGIYARGPALAGVTISACGLFDCPEDSARRHVRLVRAAGTRARTPHASVDRTDRPRPLVERQRHWSNR